MRIDRDAPLRFLRAAFLPDDWIAVLLKSSDTGEALQRVGPVNMVLNERFQSWLRYKNARRFSVFVSVNALTPGRRSRTRESVSAVRHLFLDADQHADRVLIAIERRPDLPAPSVIVRSSAGRAHVLWRVDGLSIERAEALQKQFAKELGTDPAATSAAQMTRLPGFLNHKYRPPQLVVVGYDGSQSACSAQCFPTMATVAAPLSPEAPRPIRRQGSIPMIERARRYLAATPPAIQGEQGDARTFRISCRLLQRFDLSDIEALGLLAEWNRCCQPSWSEAELLKKIRSARRQALSRVVTTQARRATSYSGGQ